MPFTAVAAQEHQQQDTEQQYGHQQQEREVELCRLPLQRLQAVLQLAVLPSPLHDVQVAVAIAVALPFVAQSRIAHAQLFVDAQLALRYGLVVEPLLGPLQGVECLCIASVVVQVAADGHVAVGHLVGVTILREPLQCLLPQPQRKEAVHPHTIHTQQQVALHQLMAAVVVEEGVGPWRGHQIGHSLQRIPLDVDQLVRRRLPIGGIEQVEAVQPSVMLLLRRHQCSRPLQVGRIEPLPRISRQLSVTP